MTTADAKQIELMREATPQQRSALALRLSDETIALSRRAIARSWPELDETGRAVKFVELHYGSELAGRLAGFLAARPR